MILRLMHLSLFSPAYYSTGIYWGLTKPSIHEIKFPTLGLKFCHQIPAHPSFYDEERGNLTLSSTNGYTLTSFKLNAQTKCLASILSQPSVTGRGIPLGYDLTFIGVLDYTNDYLLYTVRKRNLNVICIRMMYYTKL